MEKQTIVLFHIVQEKFEAGVSLEVTVEPYNNSGNYFSTSSEIKNIYILPIPTIYWNASLKLDGEANNNFYWDPVDGAAGYTVEFVKNGETTIVPIAEKVYSFADAYAEVGTYTIRVKADADVSSDYCDSKYSNIITVERLDGPKPMGNYIKSNSEDVLKGFTVTYTNVVGANKYQLYKNGTPVGGETSSSSITDSKVIADDNDFTGGSFSYQVRSVGYEKSVSGKKYVYL